MRSLKFLTDGGSRGNPGPAASAVYFPDLGEGIGKYIGIKTNNEAEAEALILGMEYALCNGYREVEVYADSKLIVMQALGKWAVKAQTLQQPMRVIHNVIHKFEKFSIAHVRREFNKEADLCANMILDRTEGGEDLTCPTMLKIP